MNADYPEGFWPEFHHIYWRSVYKKDDRDEARNLSLLYWPHHKNIHNGDDHDLDKRLKAEADIRKPPEQRSNTKSKRNKIVYVGSMKKYDKKFARQKRMADIDYFKKNHDWLTPSKYAYKQKKLYFDNLKKNDVKQAEQVQE